MTSAAVYRQRLRRGVLGAGFLLPLVHVGWLQLGFVAIEHTEPSRIFTPVPGILWQTVSLLFCAANLCLPLAVLSAAFRTHLPSSRVLAILWAFGCVYACWSACMMDAMALHVISRA